MYFSTALCTSGDSRPMYCLIPSKLFFDPLSPHSKHPDFSLQMHIFPKQTAAHIVGEQSVSSWLLSEILQDQKMKSNSTPFLPKHPPKYPFLYCEQLSILFSLHLCCDHHLHLNQINPNISHTRDAGKLYFVHKTIGLTASWEWWWWVHPCGYVLWAKSSAAIN